MNCNDFLGWDMIFFLWGLLEVVFVGWARIDNFFESLPAVGKLSNPIYTDSMLMALSEFCTLCWLGLVYCSG
jgi:hypothetical protein